MNWKTFWDLQGQQKTNQQEQVGRISKGKIVDEATFEKIIVSIYSYLKPQPSDIVVDVCCGNGLITERLAKDCKQVFGIDQSEILIKNAKGNPHAKAVYFVGDASHMSKIINEKPNKILLYFSFQYFDTYKKGESVVAEMVNLLTPDGQIFIGDIPDEERKNVFYNSFKKKILLIIDNLRGTNSMGKFWHKNELNAICARLGVKGQYFQQPSELPFSHYRFDFLITKS